MSEVVRTPEGALEDLPDFPFEARYRELDGLRLAHVDEGEGAPVVFFHGEPTWSFLWRKVIPPVRDAGFRCIAPDLAGFGRSDKPTDVGFYSYDRHTALAGALLEQLDLRDATVVVHDWGGPIGLRIAVEQRERVQRLVILDTGLFTGHQHMSEAWMRFRDFVERTEDLPVGFLVRGACKRDPGEAVIAAYDAPYPDAASKAGARAFPLMIPLAPQAPGADAGQRVLAALRGDRRPTLMLWADSDPVLPLSTGERFAEAIGREPPRTIPDAGHFLQEDQGPLIGELVADWLSRGSAA
ncbi:MAG TPA: haloalkane dehalogenase [Solirubrobacteraceae bacterium]|nr:haloalkane dehalogenase [Solirubrobacteraceae bacterium]